MARPSMTPAYPPQPENEPCACRKWAASASWRKIGKCFPNDRQGGESLERVDHDTQDCGWGERIGRGSCCAEPRDRRLAARAWRRSGGAGGGGRVAEDRGGELRSGLLRRV